MEKHSNICVTINIVPKQFSDNLKMYLNESCESKLIDTIHEGCLIQTIKKITFDKQSKINIDGSISIKCNCICQILNPKIDDKLIITINNTNKMGYSYKIKNLCIFIPNHFVATSINDNDKVEVIIIGKRIEKDIICIAKPIHV